MGTTAEKLTYLNGTKRLLRRRLNSLGAEITLETKFRDYLLWLNRFYNAASSPVDFEILGETTQRAVNTSTNELYIPDGEIVTDGITLTISNGKITINGTATRDVWIKITNGIEAVYTNPITWISGIEIDDPYGWAEEKVIEYDEPTKTYTQFCHGTGDSVTGASGLNGVNVLIKYSNNAYSSLYQNFESFRDRTYTDMHVEGTVTSNNVVEVNCVYLYFNQGITVNQYFWLQQCLTQESTWTPNYDAAPPSPDNKKEIINKTGDITYTASDGTEFPVSLGDIELCGNPDPNGLPDRLFYSQGMFLIEKNISSSVSDGVSESWYYDSTADVYRGALHGDWSYTPSNYSLSNYFKNVVDSNIVDESTAGANLKNGEFAISYHSSEVDNTFYLKYTDLDEDDPMDTTAALKAWLSTHNTIIQYVIDGPDYILITPEEYPTLYAQLQAIIDYETKLEIEKKIF